MVENSLFRESLGNHQKLIDILLKHKNEEGVCEILNWKNEEIVQRFGCTLKIVQMYRAYCTTGWLKGTKDEKNQE